MTMARNEPPGLWGDCGHDDEWQRGGRATRRYRFVVEEVAAADIAA
jgi:hypothetical protein